MLLIYQTTVLQEFFWLSFCERLKKAVKTELSLLIKNLQEMPKESKSVPSINSVGKTGSTYLHQSED